jgi:hypothetical protein
VSKKKDTFLRGRFRKIKVGISNRLVGRTERPKKMVPEERGRYKKDD